MDLVDMMDKAAAFNGPEYKADRDFDRLNGQARRIFDLMKDQQWRTLNHIAELTGDPAASISAQLRHLRKPKWGSHTVKRRYVGFGLHEYQLIPNEVGIVG